MLNILIVTLLQFLIVDAIAEREIDSGHEGRANMSYWTKERIDAARPFDNGHEGSTNSSLWTKKRIDGARPFDFGTAFESRSIYWTKQRMAAAKPMGEILFNSDEIEELESAGPGHYINTDKWPWWNTGKYFFTKPGGDDYVCSFSRVARCNIFLTAGHCCRDKSGKFYHNQNLMQGYWKSSAKSGGTHVKGYGSGLYMTYSQFTGPANDDWCIIVAGSTGSAWLGIRFDTTEGDVTAVGYANNYYSGNWESGSEGHITSDKNGALTMSNNLLSPGASGGAWVNFCGDGCNHQVGIHAQRSAPTTAHSASFTQSSFISQFNIATKFAEEQVATC